MNHCNCFAHLCKPIQNKIRANKCLLVVGLHGACELTFSSPDATLKTSSTTEPTARRAALDEWTSFQMVSLSTCQQRQRHEVLGCLYHVKLYWTVFHLFVNLGIFDVAVYGVSA